MLILQFRRYKSNPVYPKPEMVRQEIVQMTKGVAVSIFCPALSIWYLFPAIEPYAHFWVQSGR